MSNINNKINYLLENQLQNGGFTGFKFNQYNPENKNSFASPLATAKILFYLNKINDKKLEPETVSKLAIIKNKAAEFLLSQKSNNWTFNFWPRESLEAKTTPDDLNTTFSALSALCQYNPSLINGSALAQILINLTSLEVQEGGPYYSWIIQGKNNVDLGTNINISLFLYLQEANLPILDNLIDEAISSKNLFSDFYFSSHPLICLISQFYKGEKKEQLQKYLLTENLESDYAKKILSTLSLLNLGLEKEKAEQIILELNNYSNKDQYLGPIFTFPAQTEKIFIACPALEEALMINILEKYNNLINENTTLEKNPEQQEQEKIYNQITDKAKERFSNLNIEFKTQALKFLEKIIKHDKDKQIVLLPYFFAKSLKQEYAVPQEMIVELGLANLYVWMAYTIYDDFLDEEGDPKTVSVANICLREFIIIFNNILPQSSPFHNFFRRVMDILDGANAWETTNCRAIINQNEMQLPEKMPDYGDFSKLSERSIAHGFGPIAILFYLGFDANSEEVKNLYLFFKHYLIGRQMNDDAHDWEEDIKRGHINSCIALTLNNYDGQKINFENDFLDIQKKFWLNVIEKESQITLDNLDIAEKAIKSIKALNNTSIFESFMSPIRGAAQKAIQKRLETEQFLKEYSNN